MIAPSEQRLYIMIKEHMKYYFLSDYSLFEDVNREEIRKVNIVASLLLVSVCSILLGAVTKVCVLAAILLLYMTLRYNT